MIKSADGTDHAVRKTELFEWPTRVLQSNPESGMLRPSACGVSSEPVRQQDLRTSAHSSNPAPATWTSLSCPAGGWQITRPGGHHCPCQKITNYHTREWGDSRAARLQLILTTDTSADLGCKIIKLDQQNGPHRPADEGAVKNGVCFQPQSLGVVY